MVVCQPVTAFNRSGTENRASVSMAERIPTSNKTTIRIVYIHIDFLI